METLFDWLEQTPEAQQDSTQDNAEDSTQNYLPIDLELERRAWHAVHMGEFKGTATAEYRAMVDEARQVVAAKQAQLAKSQFATQGDRDTVERLLSKFEHKLAENFNARHSNAASCPSWFIVGAANYPMRKHEKQQAHEGRLWQEYDEIKALVDKIRQVGTGGIKSDDPHALDKLYAKLAKLEDDQDEWRRQNAWYRKHKTMAGYALCDGNCAHEQPCSFTEAAIKRMDKAIADDPLREGKPNPSWQLSNNSAEIRRIKDRIAGLQKAAERAAEQAEDGGGIVNFDGGQIVENHEAMRLQIVFGDKPDADMRKLLKSHGFRWAPSQSAWQRQLSPNARADTKYYLYPALGLARPSIAELAS